MQNGKLMHSFGIIGLIYAFFTVLGAGSGPRPQQNLLQLFENTNAASEMDAQTIRVNRNDEHARYLAVR